MFFLMAACAPATLPGSSATQTPAVPLVAPASAQALTAQAASQVEPTLLPLFPTLDLSATLTPLDANPQQAALLSYVLTDLAGAEKVHLLVAQVKPNSSDAMAKLNLGPANILRAWMYQDGALHDCPPAFFASSYVAEPNAAWKYAYLAFSFGEVSPDFSAASVRIDRIPGLAGGKGQLFNLAREGGQWKVKTQRSTWTQ